MFASQPVSRHIIKYTKLNLFKCYDKHCNNCKYSDRQAWANGVDPDQMPQNVASDQGLHRLPLVQQYSNHIYKQWNRLLQIIGQEW